MRVGVSLAVTTNSFAFNRGDAAFGYSNNFALGTLELSSLSTTALMDAFGAVGAVARPRCPANADQRKQQGAQVGR
jgi:hypothetical protein